MPYILEVGEKCVYTHYQTKHFHHRERAASCLRREDAALLEMDEILVLRDTVYAGLSVTAYDVIPDMDGNPLYVPIQFYVAPSPSELADEAKRLQHRLDCSDRREVLKAQLKALREQSVMASNGLL